MDAYGKMASSQRVFAAQPPKGAWRCQLDGCDQVFPDQRDLVRHQKTAKKHNEPSYLCQGCGANFTRKDALGRHMKTKHGIEPSAASGSYQYSQNSYRFVQTDMASQYARKTSPTPSSGSDRSISTPGSTSSSDYEYSPRSASRNLHSPQIADPSRMMAGSSLPWIYRGQAPYGQPIEALPSLHALQLPKPQAKYY